MTLIISPFVLAMAGLHQLRGRFFLCLFKLPPSLSSLLLSRDFDVLLYPASLLLLYVFTFTRHMQELFIAIASNVPDILMFSPMLSCSNLTFLYDLLLVYNIRFHRSVNGGLCFISSPEPFFRQKLRYDSMYIN